MAKEIKENKKRKEIDSGETKDAPETSTKKKRKETAEAEITGDIPTVNLLEKEIDFVDVASLETKVLAYFQAFFVFSFILNRLI